MKLHTEFFDVMFYFHCVFKEEEEEETSGILIKFKRRAEKISKNFLAMALFSSPNLRFFKIILDRTLTQGKLDLPKKFVKNNGGSLLHSKATLRLPDGAKWEVELKKSDGKISFGRGWPEFVKFYSVKAGYFVVFECEGNSCFNVLIFDLSATEINYPMKPRTYHRKNVKMKHRFTTPQRFSDEEEDEDLEMNYSRTQSNYRGSVYDYGDGGRFSPESMRAMHRRPQPLTENQERVLQKASSFKFRTKNPSFMVTMRPSYIQTGNYLSLPRSLAERYLKESVDVKLELADGRIWSVRCGVRWAFRRRRTELKGGWKRFAVDNELQEGDVCVFELINKTPRPILRVTIFHVPPN